MTFTKGETPDADKYNNYPPETIIFDGSASAPTAATGKVYYNTTDNKLQYYNGSEWLDLAANQLFFSESTYYDVFEDFNSYSTGAFTTNTKWNITLDIDGTSTATSTIVASTIAGGSTNELELEIALSGSTASTPTAEAYTIGLADNNHVWCRCAWLSNSATEQPALTYKIYAGNPTDGWTEIAAGSNTGGSTNTVSFAIIILATGSDNYTAYHGGQETALSSLTNGLELKFITSGVNGGGDVHTGSSALYIDDFRVSKHTV